jgi:diacylglycerol kinase (ATP)
LPQFNLRARAITTALMKRLVRSWRYPPEDDMSARKLRLLILVNPKASRAPEALPKLLQWCAGRSDVLLKITDDKTALEPLLIEHGARAERIAIGGGDGTLSHALPQLLKLNTPVAVLPLGTANDLARTLGIPTDPLAAAETALRGREHPIDIGLANSTPYLNVASVGAASKLITAQSPELKKRWRVLAYAIGLLRSLRDIQPFFVELDVDDGPSWSAAVYQVSVGNGRHHGGGLTVAEEAAIDDGKLHLYLVYPGTFWQLVACLTHLRFGLMRPSVLDRHSATRVRLRTSRPRPVNADGGLATKTPVEFTLLRQALTVIVPKDLSPEHAGLSELKHERV